MSDMIDRGCLHQSQVVVIQNGVSVQKCTLCGEVLAKWLAKTGKELYSRATISKPKY